MIETPRTLYASNSHDFAVIFDLCFPTPGKRFSRKHTVPGEQADTKLLYLTHPVLLVKAKAAREAEK